MSPVFRLLVALVVPVALAAQGKPQLVWEGEVDGSALIFVRGSKIRVEDKGAGFPVQGKRYRFDEKLPENRQIVDVRRVRGRGEVHVVEQPTLENDYTLCVAIDDRQPGSALYSLEFYWDPGNTSRDPFAKKKKLPSEGMISRPPEKLAWSGRVDDEAVISCRGSLCQSTVKQGDLVRGERYRFTQALPSRQCRVSLEEPNGRGEIRILEQPTSDNGYTAVVLVRDSEAGAADYSFTLSWSRDGREDRH